MLRQKDVNAKKKTSKEEKKYWKIYQVHVKHMKIAFLHRIFSKFFYAWCCYFVWYRTECAFLHSFWQVQKVRSRHLYFKWSHFLCHSYLFQARVRISFWMSKYLECTKTKRVKPLPFEAAIFSQKISKCFYLISISFLFLTSFRSDRCISKYIDTI